MILPGFEPHDQLPLEPEPKYYCDNCGDGIQEGESFYRMDCMNYCKYCIESCKETA